MKKSLHFIIISLTCFFFVRNSYGQHSFGLEFGHNWKNISGLDYDFDSIRVIPSTGGEVGEGFGGVFYEYQLSRKITLHNKLNYGPRYIDFDVYNKDQSCQFCPIRKNDLVAIKSLALEVFPQYNLVGTENFKLNLFLGFNATFNFVSKQKEIVFEDQPGLSEVFNSLNDIVNPVTYSLGYGASMEVYRVLFWAKILHPSAYSDSIEIGSQEYDFKNSWSFVSISIGYKFYRLRSIKD